MFDPVAFLAREALWPNGFRKFFIRLSRPGTGHSFNSRFLDWEPGVSVLPCEFIPPDQFLADLSTLLVCNANDERNAASRSAFLVVGKETAPGSDGEPCLLRPAAMSMLDRLEPEAWKGGSLFRLSDRPLEAFYRDVPYPYPGIGARDPIDVVVEAEGLPAWMKEFLLQRRANFAKVHDAVEAQRMKDRAPRSARLALCRVWRSG